jgi:hypothetical protein
MTFPTVTTSCACHTLGISQCVRSKSTCHPAKCQFTVCSRYTRYSLARRRHRFQSHVVLLTLGSNFVYYKCIQVPTSGILLNSDRSGVTYFQPCLTSLGCSLPYYCSSYVCLEWCYRSSLGASSGAGMCRRRQALRLMRRLLTLLLVREQTCVLTRTVSTVYLEPG